MEQDKILNTYYDHYKETYALSMEAKTRRNKNFVFLCVFEAISFILIRNPDFICAMLNDSIRKELATTIVFSNNVIQTLVWILIAYVLVRYVQDVMYIERQYNYLDSIEKKISLLMGADSVFKREGDHYLQGYPIVLNLIDLFYKMFCPILFTAINVTHIVQEWKGGTDYWICIIDSIICLAIVVVTWFFFFEIHKKTTEWCKRHIPGIRRISERLHKILKEV